MIWALKAMQKKYNEAGLTSTIDRSQGPEGFRVYQTLRQQNQLTVRSTVTYLISGQGTPDQVRQEVERIPFVTGMGDEWFRVGPIKVVADGGILIGTAYLREPYGAHTAIYGYDDPEYRGVLSVPRENLIEMARVANRLGWQMTAHTTGGGATDALLDAYEAANRDRPIADRRFTVTHGNFPNAQAIQRARRLGVAFDSQPAWLHLDGAAIKDVFGLERMRDFLPLKSMFDAGVIVAGGSDHMIRFDSRTAINPTIRFSECGWRSRARRRDGATLGPEQTVTREQALRMWTLNGAWMSFEEKTKGSIEPGKLADMVVISKDYLRCPVDEIKDIDALLTVVGGQVVYRNAMQPPPLPLFRSDDQQDDPTGERQPAEKWRQRNGLMPLGGRLDGADVQDLLASCIADPAKCQRNHAMHDQARCQRFAWATSAKLLPQSPHASWWARFVRSISRLPRRRLTVSPECSIFNGDVFPRCAEQGAPVVGPARAWCRSVRVGEQRCSHND